MQVMAVAEAAAGVDEEAPPRNDGKNDGKTDYIEVAEISSSHGLKGEVRVMPLTDFPVQRLESVRKVHFYKTTLSLIRPGPFR
jgi:hypothetical protein